MNTIHNNICNIASFFFSQSNSDGSGVGSNKATHTKKKKKNYIEGKGTNSKHEEKRK
jgi:hypothetical protein